MRPYRIEISPSAWTQLGNLGARTLDRVTAEIGRMVLTMSGRTPAPAPASGEGASTRVRFTTRVEVEGTALLATVLVDDSRRILHLQEVRRLEVTP